VAKKQTPTYILTLPLVTTPHHEIIINKRFEIGRNIYNSVLGNAKKRYNLMLESKEYSSLKKKLNATNKKYHKCEIKKLKSSINKERNELYKLRNNLYLKYKLTQYSLYKDVGPMYKHFKDNIGSLEAQAIADRVWASIDKLLTGTGKTLHFKRYEELDSIQNKWNKSGLKFNTKTNMVIWNDLEMPVFIKAKDKYAQSAIQDRVKYCRITRKLIRGRYKYYVQLAMKGYPPIKCNVETGEVRHSIGLGNVGLDIGARTLAISSNSEVRLLELCPEVENIQRVRTNLSRKLDRQRRANNPNNYNENGTIKRGIKLTWFDSKSYIRTKNKLRDIQRKQADIRKQSHNKLANYIISLGDRIFVETMSFSGLQRRSKKTTINAKTGKFNKKKRFGKSLASKAPAKLIEIINQKSSYEGLEILKINTQKAKASQYNHLTDDYTKKDLKNRWNESIKVQRDCYSAFLIMNINDNLETINRESCLKTYDNFKRLHDVEINKLKDLKLSGIKLISSMGI